MLDSNTSLIWTLVFEWYVIWCGFKNGHQKKIGLCAQIFIIILMETIKLGRGGHI
jgi:hypothetical protein